MLIDIVSSRYMAEVVSVLYQDIWQINTQLFNCKRNATDIKKPQ